MLTNEIARSILIKFDRGRESRVLALRALFAQRPELSRGRHNRIAAVGPGCGQGLG